MGVGVGFASRATSSMLPLGAVRHLPLAGNDAAVPGKRLGLRRFVAGAAFFGRGVAVATGVARAKTAVATGVGVARGLRLRSRFFSGVGVAVAVA